MTDITFALGVLALLGVWLALANLAFGIGPTLEVVKIGIRAASVFSGIEGVLLFLRWNLEPNE